MRRFPSKIDGERAWSTGENPTLKKIWFACALALCAPLAARGGERPPNIILITLDTTRADHLGCYGGKDGLTPRIDALAARGVVFENAIVPIPETAPSHLSIFTGLYPYRHGVYRNGVFPHEHPALMAELLKAAGYRTAAFASAKHLVVPDYVRGFEVVEQAYPDYSRTATAVTDKALQYLQKTPPGAKPCFIWIHYFDPHYPYLPPEQFRVDPDPEKTKALRIYLAWLGLDRNEMYYADRLPPDERDLVLHFFKERTLVLSNFVDPAQHKLDRVPAVAWYGGEIKYMDSELGRLFDYLESSGIMKDSLVVIVADHGETLLLPGGFPHFNHGQYLQDREVRVPLIFFDGRGEYAPRRVTAQVRTLDILPTTLAVSRLAAPKGLDGVSLEPSLRGKKQSLPREAFTHSGTKEHESVRTDRWKLIYDVFTENKQLYDLSKDPDEVEDLVQREPAVTAKLLKDLKDWIAMRNASGKEGEIDPHMVDVLKSLGYMK